MHAFLVRLAHSSWLHRIKRHISHPLFHFVSYPFMCHGGPPSSFSLVYFLFLDLFKCRRSTFPGGCGSDQRASLPHLKEPKFRSIACVPPHFSGPFEISGLATPILLQARWYTFPLYDYTKARTSLWNARKHPSLFPHSPLVCRASPHFDVPVNSSTLANRLLPSAAYSFLPL